MRRFFRRLKLAWAAFCLREADAYRAILEGRPVMSDCVIRGTVDCSADGGVYQRSMAHRDDGKGDGFRLGANSVCVGCVAAGWGGYGYNTSGHASASIIQSPSVPDVFGDWPKNFGVNTSRRS